MSYTVIFAILPGILLLPRNAFFSLGVKFFPTSHAVSTQPAEPRLREPFANPLIGSHLPSPLFPITIILPPQPPTVKVTVNAFQRRHRRRRVASSSVKLQPDASDASGNLALLFFISRYYR